MRLGEIWIEGKSSLIVLDCLSCAPTLALQISQVAISVGIIGLVRERLAIAVLRFIELSQLMQRSPHAVVRLGHIRLECQRSLEVCDCLVQLSAIHQQVAKILQCYDVVGIVQQCLLIGAASLIQPSLPAQDNGELLMRLAAVRT